MAGPFRSSQEVWNTVHEGRYRRAQEKETRINNQSLAAKNIIELLYKQKQTEELEQKNRDTNMQYEAGQQPSSIPGMTQIEADAHNKRVGEQQDRDKVRLSNEALQRTQKSDQYINPDKTVNPNSDPAYMVDSKLGRDKERLAIKETQQKVDGTYNAGPPDPSEFERLLADPSLGYTPAQKKTMRRSRAANIASGSGEVTTFSPDGKITITKGSAGVLTNSARAKVVTDHKANKVSYKTFNSTKERLFTKIKTNPSQLGFTGTLAQMSEEIMSVADNIVSSGGFDISAIEGKGLADYKQHLPKGVKYTAIQAAGTETALFSLALIYAGMAGLGEGRALTDTDVKRAVKAVGGSTNSFEMLQEKMNEAARISRDRINFKAEEYPNLLQSLDGDFGSSTTPQEGQTPIGKLKVIN